MIFDLDGLLVDSEPLQFRAYQQAFADHDLDFREPDWAVWHRIGSSAAAWLAHTGSKVDPEVFNLAVIEMGLSRRRTVAIEDSAAGLQAARAAGLPCVVCPDEFVARGQGEYHGAALMVSSLADLSTQVLEQVCLCHDSTQPPHDAPGPAAVAPKPTP